MAPFSRYWQPKLRLFLLSIRHGYSRSKTKVVETGTNRRRVWDFPLVYHIAMAISCIISETKRDIGRSSKIAIFSYPFVSLHNDPRRRKTVANIFAQFYSQNYNRASWLVSKQVSNNVLIKVTLSRQRHCRGTV